MNRQVESIMVNCRQIDTQYRVLSHIGNSLLEEYEQDEIPFTGGQPTVCSTNSFAGWTDEAASSSSCWTKLTIWFEKQVTSLQFNQHEFFTQNGVYVIGISNDLKFTDFLDPRVRSRLGQLDVLFRPYDAEQLQNILRQRAEEGLEAEAIGPGVIELCAARCTRARGCSLRT